ncbi:hypothetical protein CCM_00790 [Cordyceps militaris CM01]|uniref:Zn(II)2Cys6 transcription factor n=1 Tax=Cordyceps militaris (strain CM01) TaxID=983644 RepID=G3J631_CORMM|nr:uncharacterized protein CCM_00790 [Cordyceps militaris CM01]EGX96135.1 hypothetical protein CCM_00790 [Cordyceps militaris CM01]
MSCPISAEDAATGRKRTSTACEACRVAKTRCLPSDEAGSTNLGSPPSTGVSSPRRNASPGRALGDGVPIGPNCTPPGDQLPPPPKPTGTFTIDIPLARPSDVGASTSTLRDSHAAYLDNLFSPTDPITTTSFSSSSASPFPWPGSSSISSEAASSPHSSSSPPPFDPSCRPSFNIASAASLLDTFRDGMLGWCPCVLVPAHLSVQTLARTRPFVLLAILAAAAAGARSLRGHALYDDEFRKVFALKLVAGGERSVELLQGLLVYCLWYPFHLRPRVRHVFQYTRMAADLVHDLQLDVQAHRVDEPMTPERLDAIRAYVAQYYLSSSRGSSVPFTAWTERCCQLLVEHAACPGDAVLASLARLGRTVREAWAAVRDGAASSNSSLVFRGLEAQFQDQQASLPPAVSNTCTMPPLPVRRLFPANADTQAVPIRLQTLFTEFFLLGGSILRMPTSKPSPPTSSSDPFLPTPARLRRCVDVVAEFLALLRTTMLGPPSSSSLAHFSTGDWGRLVLGVVVAMRLSFPLAECPAYDDGAWARDRLGFVAFLDAMTGGAADGVVRTGAAKQQQQRVDVVSASKVVLAVVKEKYEQRLALLMRRQQEMVDAGEGWDKVVLPRSTCPMLDGSLDRYFPLWDGSGAQSVSVAPQSFAEGEASGDGDAMLDAWAEELFDWIEPMQDLH